MINFLLCLSICLAVTVRAEMPRVDSMAFFKQSVGTWKGKGTSIVGPNKSKLEVTDDWKGELSADGKAFIQVGKVTLSNGSSFDYRWVYQVDPKSEKVAALYTDSQKVRSIFLVQIADDQSKLSVLPLKPTGEPATAGLFCTLFFKEGTLSYEAEVRDEAGKPFVQTTVACMKQETPSAN